MSPFTEGELVYLQGERRPARLATVGPDGMPHVAPVGWSYNAELATIEVRGRDLTRTKKFRDVAHSGRAAIVIDDVLPPWQPRGIEIRGEAEAIDGPNALIRIHPQRIVSWGVEIERQARDMNASPGNRSPRADAGRYPRRARSGARSNPNPS